MIWTQNDQKIAKVLLCTQSLSTHCNSNWLWIFWHEFYLINMSLQHRITLATWWLFKSSYHEHTLRPIRPGFSKNSRVKTPGRGSSFGVGLYVLKSWKCPKTFYLKIKMSSPLFRFTFLLKKTFPWTRMGDRFWLKNGTLWCEEKLKQFALSNKMQL